MADEEKKPAAFVSAVGREKIVPLEFPVEFDGKTWSEVRIRRVTGKEVETYLDGLVRGERPMPPMFDCPHEVYDAMDDDDRLALDEAVVPFLPRRLKAAAAQAGTPFPETGDTTSGS